MSKPKYEWFINSEPYLYEEAGFTSVKRLDSGLEIGVIKMLFTWDLCCNINPDNMFDAYEYRYSYATEYEAVEALLMWDGDGHPPGNWIKRQEIEYGMNDVRVTYKSGGPEISNPNYKSNDN